MNGIARLLVAFRNSIFLLIGRETPAPKADMLNTTALQDDQTLAEKIEGVYGPLRCDVCGGKADGVYASTLGAISFAYCRYCGAQNAEPAGMLYCTVRWDCGGLQGCAEWVKSLSTFYNGRYYTVVEFMALPDLEKVFPDPYSEKYPCGKCGYILTGPECCPVCYPDTTP